LFWKLPAAHGSHSKARGAALKLPGRHSVCEAAPPEQKDPIAQSKHVGVPLASLTLPYVPGSQLGGSCRLLPSGQKAPGRHGTHEVAFSSGWCDPAAHSAQRLLRGVGEWLPGRQGSGAVEPGGQLLPTGQSEQAVALPREVELE